MNRNAACTSLSMIVMILCLCASSWGQKRADSPLDQVKTQIRRGELGPAVDALRAYLNASTASVGDPNIDDAKRILLQTSDMYASSLEKSGDYLEAANVLLDTAAVSGLGDKADALRQEAKASLQRSFKIVLGKHQIPQALAIADAYSQHFPADAPLLDAKDRTKLQVDALAATKNSARPSFVLREYKRLKAAGITTKQFQAAGIDESDLIARYAEALLERGWFLQAASFARTELTVGTPSPQDKSRLEKVSEKALSAYFDACQMLGNAKMIADASTRYSDSANSKAEAAKITRMQAAAKRVADKLTPKPLTFAAKFVEGKGSWADDGTGYAISQPIHIGHDGHNGGGAWKSAQIEIMPGFYLNNGEFWIENGTVTLKGSPDRPVIFKGVTINCDYTGGLTASNAIFIDCHFKKSGGWHWNGGFSSKWQLSDCLVVGSGFDSLSQRDYGIKLERCTFVDVPFPDRLLTDDASKDNTGLYHNPWNTIADCQFYQCQLPPSLLWANGKCALVDCTISGEANFASSKPLQSDLFIPKDDVQFAPALKAATKDKGNGAVNYTITETDSSRLRDSPLWHFVPNLPDITEGNP